MAIDWDALWTSVVTPGEAQLKLGGNVNNVDYVEYNRDYGWHRGGGDTDCTGSRWLEGRRVPNGALGDGKRVWCIGSMLCVRIHARG